MEMDGLESMTLEQLLAQYKEKTKMPKIRSLKRQLGYLEARKVAEPYGGLPTNLTHKRTLVDTDDWQSPELKGYYPAWAREILVYPESNGVFPLGGQDVIDAYKDDKGRTWTYPAFCIPNDALNRRNVALFVTPRHIEETEKQVTVIADPNKDVVVLPNFPQSSQWGNVDEKTGVPLLPLLTKKVDTSSNAAGYLWRLSTAGVRPLVRDYVVYNYGRGVVADGRRDGGFGVGVESLEEAPQNLESLTLGQLLSVVKKK